MSNARRINSIHVYVDGDDLAALDAVAEHRRTSRSAAARGLLHPALINEVKRLADEAPPINATALAVLRATGVAEVAGT